MILAWLVFIPLVGGALAWALARRHAVWCRWTALGALALGLGLSTYIWLSSPGLVTIGSTSWVCEVTWPWMPTLGINFHLGLDGLGLLLVWLTYFLGLASVLASWETIDHRVGFFHLCLLACLSGTVGVFTALDLFLFYFSWELMLIPMYFLIAVWGHSGRRYAAMKFVIFTQAGGMLMLLSILGLYFAHGRATGVYTFDYDQLLGSPLAPLVALWIALGFFLAFAVKLPMVPLHVWLPDAHTEAPTAGSVILAGLFLKTGGYGLLRFVVPLFPGAAAALAPVAMLLGAAGILYGAVLAFAQTDLKRLVAYSSISHLGFVLMGVFSGTDAGLRGAVVQMIAHGLTTGALFILAGELQHRAGTRDFTRLGGIWSRAPALAATGMVLALASLGLPGMANFVGEFLVLLGVYQTHVGLAAVAAVGLVLAAVYSLRMVRDAFFGPRPEALEVTDLGGRERALMGVIIALILLIGLFAQPLIDTAAPAAVRARDAMQGAARQATVAGGQQAPVLGGPAAGPRLFGDSATRGRIAP